MNKKIYVCHTKTKPFSWTLRSMLQSMNWCQTSTSSTEHYLQNWCLLFLQALLLQLGHQWQDNLQTGDLSHPSLHLLIKKELRRGVLYILISEMSPSRTLTHWRNLGLMMWYSAVISGSNLNISVGRHENCSLVRNLFSRFRTLKLFHCLHLLLDSFLFRQHEAHLSVMFLQISLHLDNHTVEN